MVFSDDPLWQPVDHVLDVVRADGVNEQTFGASDQRLHGRVVKYRRRAAANSESAGIGFGISIGNGAGDARLQDEGTDGEDRGSRIFGEDLFAGQ